MLRSLVGSEMCIRDRYQRRVREPGRPKSSTLRSFRVPASLCFRSRIPLALLSSHLCTMANPLLEDWTVTDPEFGMPPFARIEPAHFRPAFDAAMASHLADLEAIVADTRPADFDSVVAPLDRAGADFGKIDLVFSNLCSSLNTKPMQTAQTEMAPLLARHWSSVYTFPGLFEKIQRVHSLREEAGLTPEQVRLVERFYTDGCRHGAKFDQKKKLQNASITARLAELETQFSQNVMADEGEWRMEVSLSGGDLAGCPDTLIAAARTAAEEAAVGNKRPAPDVHVITLNRSLVEPFLTFADDRGLRQKAWEAWTKRGELEASRANQPIAEEILKLRQEQAALHEEKSFAHYQCADMMAKTPTAVMELLENVWVRAKGSADTERGALEEYVKSQEGALAGGIMPWDWRYYAEKVRRSKYDFDEAELKPYLSLEAVTDAVMAVSNKLFGLRYVPRPDLQLYHPDAQAYEVRETDPSTGADKLVAVFISDNFARPFKSSGAWMSEYRGQTKNLAPGQNPILGVPIISNNNNFARGDPTLLSFDDATTLFHEMGHAHHGMLSDCTYSRLAGTNVLTDFVELPSQLMEHWLEQPEVLREFAKHYQTGDCHG
eukprot:TRINITY_DN9319_c0_g1_i3.p1 TRINITY_DN9319_c0_g1~~TRINITY_DN9319_c0_g1_i3.p1  ORF type:complete len:655 (+),score=134.46 TRINITY_DN9319_c0_g1_i3:152-1966(+)